MPFSLATILWVLKTMDDLFLVIDDMIEIVELKDDEISDFSDKLFRIYSDKDFRHSYAEISKFLQEIYSDQRSELPDKLDLILLHMNGNKKYIDVITKVGKLTDHIELETIRLDRMEYINYIGKTAADDRKKAEQILDESKRSVSALTRKINNAQSQIITILGIFSGIVITFSVGSQIVADSFKNINELNFFKLCFFAILIIMSLINLLFILMYIISKISGINISVKCRNISCDNCTQGHNLLSRLNRKYPYVLYYNLIMFLFMIIFIVYMICEKII